MDTPTLELLEYPRPRLKDFLIDILLPSGRTRCLKTHLKGLFSCHLVLDYKALDCPLLQGPL